MKIFSLLIFIISLQSAPSFAGCDPCVCGWGGEETEEQQRWIEESCRDIESETTQIFDFSKILNL